MTGIPLFEKRISKSAGLPPGTLVHVGEKKMDKTTIEVMDYTEGEFTEKRVKRIEECFQYKGGPSVTWININGLHEVDIIDKLGKQFGFHPLLLEDILNTTQRPKIEDYDDYMFIVLKMLTYSTKKNKVDSEQMSMILCPGLVITFQEKAGDVFDPIRDRIRKSKGRIRKMGPDYLCYSLMDALVDNYFLILENISTQVEDMEDVLLKNPRPKQLQTIHRMKQEMIHLRRSVWPLRELISNLERSESDLVSEAMHPYLRDLYDHTIQVIDNMETLRDTLSGLTDLYLSSVSNKMNEVMKVLTIIATIFIPLTFIAGIYGMNFNTDKSPFNMPELDWYLGYPLALGAMLVVFIGMLIFFKRKGWL